MLNNTSLSKMVYDVLQALMKPISIPIEIIEENQSAPRPLDDKGFNKNYIYYRILPLVQTHWSSNNFKNGQEQLTGIRNLSVSINILGNLANDISNYLLDAIASHVGSEILDKYHLYFNELTDPEDLTYIEGYQWLKRVHRELSLGFIDGYNFDIDSFTNIDTSVTIDSGIAKIVTNINIKKEK